MSEELGLNERLEGRVAVVVGASRGLGREIARAIAMEGAAVVIAGRSKRDLGVTAELLRTTAGRGPLVVQTDVSDAAQVDRLRRETEDRFGPASILVNSAGIFGPIAPIADVDPAAWLETLRVNTAGPFLTCRAFSGQMVTNGWGRIVNVSSAAALSRPESLNSAYVTSKVALNQLTRHLAAELAGTGVTANVMHPGSLKTEMWQDIRRQVMALGDQETSLRSWVAMVEETGGDSAASAVRLVLRLLGPDGAETNGAFCWPDGTLEEPLASW